MNGYAGYQGYLSEDERRRRQMAGIEANAMTPATDVGSGIQKVAQALAYRQLQSQMAPSPFADAARIDPVGAAKTRMMNWGQRALGRSGGGLF